MSSREIRPLQILTGGNPRLLVIVAEFARHRSLRLLMEELVTLIDEHTEYFRGHLEVFAKTERRVYISVIDLWQPSSPGEIAARARMGVRTVSTMLGRLVERGVVIVEGSGRKRQYAAAERLYSIYYKLRRERDEAAIVENLVKFMVVFYSGSELVDMSDGLVMEAAESTVIRTGIFRALADRLRFENPTPPAKWRIMQQVSERAIEKAQSTVEKELLEEINASRQARAFENVIETVERIIVSRSTDRTQLSELFIARILHCKADAQEQLGHFQAVVATCEEVVVRFGDSVVPGLQWRVAEALIDMGRVRKEMGDLDAATAACEEVVERFGDSEESDVQWWVAAALVDNGRSKKELGDLEGAIATWDEVAERYGDTDVSDASLEWWVALALIDKGRAKKEQGDPVGAIDTWEEVVHRYGLATPTCQMSSGGSRWR